MTSRAQHRWRLLVEGGHSGGLVLFPLDVPDAEREAHARLLSELERARAARFHSAVDGARFLVAHGQLRRVLAVQLGLPPEAVGFVAGPHGKPGLAGAAAASGLCFNMSHSGDLGLVGWSWHREIGVDVEVWRPTRDQAALVRRFFSPAEIAAWEALPLEQRHEAFFNLWTRKEAYVKALGRGLSLALDSFDVSHMSGVGARLLRASRLARDGRSWSIASPDVAAEVSIAVALAADACQVVPESGGLE